MIGFGPEGGTLGIGGAIHAGSPGFGVYLGGSLAPVLTVQSKPAFNVFATGDFRGDLYVYPGRTERGRFGALGGISYNTLLGTGFNVGGGGTLRLARSLELSLRLVFSFYPDASDRVRDHLDPADGEASSPWLQGGAEIALLIYP
ncbi:MAG TPA: hypothetical protein VFK02_33730 [Kofleriaceae bacterium]|nr:hypothetical protein [Kofleriaceae bacterium]